MALQPLGYLKSCFPEKFGTPRQPHLVPHSRASLKLSRSLQPEQILAGLEEFSHVWLISLFHQNTNKSILTKVHPPRMNGQSVGVFASRTPHRPNPIGLSLVRLVKIEQDTLYFSEIDLVDGTPIVDIKPYIQEIDSRFDSDSGWVARSQPLNVPVAWTAQALIELENVLPLSNAHVSSVEFRELVREVLSQDPRAPMYKTSEFENVENERAMLGMALYDLNVLFIFINGRFEITSVEIYKKQQNDNLSLF